MFCLGSYALSHSFPNIFIFANKVRQSLAQCSLPYFLLVVFKEFDLILHLGRINTWWNILEVWFSHGSSFSRHLIINLLIAILLVCFKFFIIAKSTSICVLLHKALHFRSCFGIDSWKRKHWIKLSSLFYGSWYGLIIVCRSISMYKSTNN